MSKKVKDKSSSHIGLDIVQRDESYMGRTGCTNDLYLLWSVRYRILAGGHTKHCLCAIA
jgi:hypothetical protein